MPARKQIPKVAQINGPVTSNAYVNPYSTTGVNSNKYVVEYTDTGSNKNSGKNYSDVLNNLASTKKTPSYNYNIPKYNFGGGGSLSRIGAFQPSEAYNQAMAYTQSLLDQLNSGRTAYSDKVDALMAKIEGREKFSYDFNTDPLFQNALASAMASGQTAMQDTIGQASALTGGYGSSYATSAANQTYNEFVKGAYDKLPDYYNIALNAYNMEGQEMYNQLGMYREADNTAYSRLANAYSANLANADSMYNREYSNYWDTANYNRAVDEFNANMAYKNASLKASQANASLKASTSKAGSSGSTESVKDFSASDLNALQSRFADIAKVYGADSQQVNQAAADAIAAGYPEWQVFTMLDGLDRSGYSTYTIKEGKGGNPTPYNAYGETISSNRGFDATFTLTDLGSATKASKPAYDTKYIDNFGNEWTYEQLKQKGWSKYIK